MKKISNKKLEKIVGGEITVWTILAVSAIVIFISGVIEGYTHPKACNN